MNKIVSLFLRKMIKTPDNIKLRSLKLFFFSFPDQNTDFLKRWDLFNFHHISFSTHYLWSNTKYLVLTQPNAFPMSFSIISIIRLMASHCVFSFNMSFERISFFSFWLISFGFLSLKMFPVSSWRSFNWWI